MALIGISLLPIVLQGFDVDGVRLNSRFAPFAVPKGFKDVIAEVEEGVEV